MFAVFSSGGKQHRVTEGEVIKLERLTAEPGEEVVFDKVLIVADGDQVTVGQPYVEGGKVTLRTPRAMTVSRVLSLVSFCCSSPAAAPVASESVRTIPSRPIHPRLNFIETSFVLFDG